MASLPKSHTRVAVENVQPNVDGGRFAVKRIVGDLVIVTADVFTDGHDEIAVELAHFVPGTHVAQAVAAMRPVGNDVWVGEFRADAIGFHAFAVRGFVDRFATWRRDLRKRLDAGQDVAVDSRIGAELLHALAERAAEPERSILIDSAAKLQAGELEAAFSTELAEVAYRHADRESAGASTPVKLWVDRPKARFGTWYEVFPRSCGGDPHKHGTLRDLERRLPAIAKMGFDTLYLPPIHPIGRTHRKGKNNALAAGAHEPGCPWAVGNEMGGHDAIHPELGGLDDFRRLVAAAGKLGIEIALDFAVQCSPDHPYVAAHPEWFRKRPDGTIQYAENPPKKYQDIYPLDFDSPAADEMWEEWKRVVLFWVREGVRIFRVDNPHTKPFAFWEWLIAEVRTQHPDVLFLSEAFTRPRPMYRLAKLGFTQSYTYFTWRNGKDELTQYLAEITRPPVSDFFRPNLWPNTPDILHDFLQHGGPPAFALRYVLAATLSSSIGVFGPAYEHAERTPREPGSEEYLNSEKYEIRVWDWDGPATLRPLISRMNAIRRSEPALQRNDGLRFHRASDPHVMCYSKSAPNALRIVTVVNLDPHGKHAATVELPLHELGVDPGRPYRMHDLLDGAVYEWRGPTNYVELDPGVRPAHVFRIEQEE